MKEIISFLVKALLASLLGIIAASFAENVSRYQYAEVALFFFGAIAAFYFVDGLFNKIMRS